MTSSYPDEVASDVDAHPEWPARAAAAIADMMGTSDHVFLVADAPENPRLAGCIGVSLLRYVPGLDWGARHVYISDMCTDEGFRGIGLGRRLMDAALDWAREQGAQTARLDATPSAVPAYQRLGFEQRAGDKLFPTMMRHLGD